MLRYRANGKDSLRCESLESRVVFDVTWNRAVAPPPPGTIISYRYQEGLQNGLPRFPQFIRVRSDWEGL